MPIIVITDLPAAIQTAELAQLMVDGANARAARVAPCLLWDGDEDSETPAPSAEALAEAKLVLAGAIKRWSEAGAGALSQQNAGPFGQTIDTRQRTGFNLWPSEIESLQDICKTGGQSGAFSIVPTGCGSSHMPWCSLMLGALYCSCGADLTAYEYPLYEGGVLSDDTY
jgi:hypothetical protein